VLEARADGTDVADLLAAWDARPAQRERLSARNAVAALRRHDWGHRWQSILKIAGCVRRPALTARLRACERLADDVGVDLAVAR
jgi:hypothetical protein